MRSCCGPRVAVDEAGVGGFRFRGVIIGLCAQPFGEADGGHVARRDIADGGVPAQRAKGVGDAGRRGLCGDALPFVLWVKEDPADFAFGPAQRVPVADNAQSSPWRVTVNMPKPRMTQWPSSVPKKFQASGRVLGPPVNSDRWVVKQATKASASASMGARRVRRSVRRVGVPVRVIMPPSGAGKPWFRPHLRRRAMARFHPQSPRVWWQVLRTACCRG